MPQNGRKSGKELGGKSEGELFAGEFSVKPVCRVMYIPATKMRIRVFP